MNIKEKLEKFNGDNREIIHVFAPGRINLIGEHIDYVGGEVLPAAITLGIDAHASKAEKISVYSEGVSDGWQTEDVKNEYTYNGFEGFFSYIKGIYNSINKRKNIELGGINISMTSNLPLSSGLSSSAAFGVLIITALNELYELGITNEEKALILKDCENGFLGLKNGIMDQFVIAVGKKNHFIKLNCGTLEYEYSSSNLEGKKFLILNSKKPRNLVESKYNERVDELSAVSKELRKTFKFENLVDLKGKKDESLSLIKDSTLHKRLRHVLTEAKRVDDMVLSLKDDNGQAMGLILNAGHESLRGDYEVSCPELDFIQENIIEIDGVFGARMVGAGFGGCVLALIENKFDNATMKNMHNDYKTKFGYDFEEYEVNIGDNARKL